MSERRVTTYTCDVCASTTVTMSDSEPQPMRALRAAGWSFPLDAFDKQCDVCPNCTAGRSLT